MVGFLAEWVKQVVNDYLKNKESENIVVPDPFAGLGTTLLACDKSGFTCWYCDMAICFVKTKTKVSKERPKTYEFLKLLY